MLVVCCLNYNERRSCCGLLSQLQRTVLVDRRSLVIVSYRFCVIVKAPLPIRGGEAGGVRVSHVLCFLDFFGFERVQKCEKTTFDVEAFHEEYPESVSIFFKFVSRNTAVKRNFTKLPVFIGRGSIF